MPKDSDVIQRLPAFEMPTRERKSRRRSNIKPQGPPLNLNGEDFDLAAYLVRASLVRDSEPIIGPGREAFGFQVRDAILTLEYRLPPGLPEMSRIMEALRNVPG